VTRLGFKGALINGQTHGEYLDHPKYLAHWEAVAELNVFRSGRSTRRIRDNVSGDFPPSS
jgi:predicted TIM-barrel fold metal-dependent hydrolase